MWPFKKRRTASGTIRVPVNLRQVPSVPSVYVDAGAVPRAIPARRYLEDFINETVDGILRASAGAYQLEAMKRTDPVTKANLQGRADGLMEAVQALLLLAQRQPDAAVVVGTAEDARFEDNDPTPVGNPEPAVLARTRFRTPIPDPTPGPR